MEAICAPRSLFVSNFSLSRSLRNPSSSVRCGLRPPVAAGVAAKPTVLVAEKLGDAGLELLKGFANVDCAYNLSAEELCTKISLCDALIVRSGTKVGREVFESSAGRLRVVGRAGVGIDNVDLSAATEHGCLVVNAPNANTVAAAEHAIALLAAMARNVAQADAALKAGSCKLVALCFFISISATRYIELRCPPIQSQSACLDFGLVVSVALG